MSIAVMSLDREQLMGFYYESTRAFIYLGCKHSFKINYIAEYSKTDAVSVNFIYDKKAEKAKADRQYSHYFKTYGEIRCLIDNQEDSVDLYLIFKNVCNMCYLDRLLN